MQLKPNLSFNLNLSALGGNVVILIVSGIAGAPFLGIVGWLQLSYDGTPAKVRVVAPSKVIDPPPPLPPSARIRALTRVAALVPSAAAPSAASAPQGAIQPAPAESPSATASPAAAGSMPTEPPKNEPLAPAPDPGLVEASPDGPLPRIDDSGRSAWRVYSKPFAASDPRPRIALVIIDIGLKSAATEAAVHRLPGLVTLSFVLYANDLQGKIDTARAARHEVLIDVPMESFYYPLNDPGPRTLLTSLSDAENTQHLLWVLSRFAGYIGVVNYMGARFTASAEHMHSVLSVLSDRRLLYLESYATAESQAVTITVFLALPVVLGDLVIDRNASRQEIDRSLAELEARARKAGRAVGLASPYPITIERVVLWVPTLPAKGLVVVPVSAVATSADGQQAAMMPTGGR